MSDINTIWSSAGTSGDWTLTSNGADLDSGNDIVTAVIISLFTDGLANTDDKVTDGTNDPRGWVGDLGQDISIGSRLWLLDRSKLTPALGPQVRDMAAAALQWLIDDGVVAKFDIITSVVMPNQLRMKVTAYKQDGTNLALDFTHAWAGIKK